MSKEKTQHNSHSGVFWSWNSLLRKDELKRQMKIFSDMGFGGFYMHSRTGLQTPYLSARWFDIVGSCMDEAKRLGMESWVYDEDRFPSGFAGGKVTADPRCRMHMFFLAEEGMPLPPGEPAGEVFEKGGKKYSFTEGEAPSWTWFNGLCYINGLQKCSAEAFLASTHDKYLEKFPGQFPGTFTDEPQYGHYCSRLEWQNCPWVTIPFSPNVRDRVQKLHGVDIFQKLPELFGLRGGEFSEVRWLYIKEMVYLFRRNYFDLLGGWHKKHKLTLTGHVMGEDTLASQSNACGDPMAYYPTFTMPGIDVLCDLEWNRMVAAQVRSVARQYGKRECLAEVYGATGWQFSPEAHKNQGDRLLLDGITYRCLHKSDYTIGGECKRDYPASISYQLPWHREYNVIEAYFARMADRLAGLDRPAKMLVLSPVESVWGMTGMDFEQQDCVKGIERDYAKCLQRLERENIPYDLGSEFLLEEQKTVRNGEFPLGKCRYSVVLLPKMNTIRSHTVELLKEFSAQGGVIVADSLPECVNGRKCDLRKAFKTIPWGSDLSKYSQVWMSENGGTASCAVFSGKGHEYLLVVNASAEFCEANGSYWALPFTPQRTIAHPNIKIRWRSGNSGMPCEYDAENDRYFKTTCRKVKGAWEITTSLDRLQSRLFEMRPESFVKALPVPALDDVETVTFSGDLEYGLTEKNSLTIDHFECPELGDGSKYVLELDRAVRDSMSLPRRAGDMVQPWCRKRSDNPARRCITLTASLDCIMKAPQGLELVMETPEEFNVFINGKEIPVEPIGWWIDKAFKRIRIPDGIVKRGKNILELRTEYHANHPGLEAVYLRGDFAVMSPKSAISELPKTLPVGKDWTKCGLLSYAGNVVCDICVKRSSSRSLVLKLPPFSGAMVRIKCGRGRHKILWHPPYSMDISDVVKPGEEKHLQLELMGNPRNVLGPFYSDYPLDCSAPQLFYDHQFDSRKIYSFGWCEDGVHRE